MKLNEAKDLYESATKKSRENDLEITKLVSTIYKLEREAVVSYYAISFHRGQIDRLMKKNNELMDLILAIPALLSRAGKKKQTDRVHFQEWLKVYRERIHGKTINTQELCQK